MEIVRTIASVTAISVGLSLIIIVAELFLNNYGDCRIDINGGKKTLTAKGGASLLTILAEHKIFIPSACGGKATCGLCKLTVLDGADPLLPTEQPYLTAGEIKNNVRLSCQVKVKRDLRIMIPENLFTVQEFKTVVEDIQQLTHDIKYVRLALQEPGQIDFKAGQFVQFYSAPYGKVKESVFRAYSMASKPSDNKIVELIIRLVPQGICTTYVHTALKIGDAAKISGPYGDFYLRGQANNLIFIAGGSGLAPMRSIILDVLEKGLDKQMTFYFGAVTRRDLYYVEFFNDLAEKNANFNFLPVLSAPAPENNWNGEVGLITEAVDRHLAAAADHEAYLCGSPGMINACLSILKKKGFTDQNIFFDKF